LRGKPATRGALRILILLPLWRHWRSWSAGNCSPSGDLIAEDRVEDITAPLLDATTIDHLLWRAVKAGDRATA